MIAFCGYAVLSFVLVGFYRHLALRQRWLDAPNARSSHTAVTPRGAGIVFAPLIIGAAITLPPHQRTTLVPLLGVAFVGWWDDLRGAPASVRFGLYALCAAVTALLIFSGWQVTRLDGAFAVSAPLLYLVLSIPALLWLINLYNFMDGINGIAATEALFVLTVIAVFAYGTPYGEAFLPLHLFAVAAIGGFLLWNFPIGKVFMGDAGSAFLGGLLGALMLWSELMGGPSPTVWLILCGVFIVDSGYTLLTRMLTGQPWYAAHRLHAYQRLSDRLRGSHARTVGILTVVNLFWLLPMAWLVHRQGINPLLGAGLAYTPLIGACYGLKAGIPASGRV